MDSFNAAMTSAFFFLSFYKTFTKVDSVPMVFLEP